VLRLSELLRRRVGPLQALACALLLGFFAWSIALMYVPGRGFTYLIEFGDRGRERYLPEVRATDHYENPDSEGYDGKAYVQIALRPNLGDPALKASVDGLAYRARRILFLWTAWLLGLGRPPWVMAAYALQNVACWLVLAFVLPRWFPLRDGDGVLRWAGVLFSFGLIFSVRSALLDGPSLLLIALAMASLERGHSWRAAALLGLSGLGKETNLLAGTALGGPGKGRFVRWLGQGALLLLPLALWVVCLTLWVGNGADPGRRNFAAPFAGFAGKAREVAAELRHAPPDLRSVPKFDALVLVGLAAQALFLALRPARRDPWWRLGAGYAVLMVFLGPGVWEGYPTAAARVLLPMTLAFNVLVPRGRRWLALLLLGNLGAVGSLDLLRPPPRSSMPVNGAPALKFGRAGGGEVAVRFVGANWDPPERSAFNFWRWSHGDCDLEITNPQDFPITAELDFTVRTPRARRVAIEVHDVGFSHAVVGPSQPEKVAIMGLELLPGRNVLHFRPDPGDDPPGVDGRHPAAFGIWNPELYLRARGP
jgi:hypothetical protein